MKRTLLILLALALLLTAGCARAGGPDILDPEGVGALPKAPSGPDELVPATAEPSPAPTDEPAPATDAPKPTDAPAVDPSPSMAEPSPAPADEPAAAAVPQAGQLTKADLVTALNAALSFYGDWVYDTAAMTDPAAKKPAATVPHLTGEMDVWPVAEGTFAAYDELFAAACRHFHEEIADVLLDEAGAQDVAGQLCIGKTAPADDAGYLCELDIERERDAFSFDLEYAPVDVPHADQDVMVHYALRNGAWAFEGRPSAINRFFTVLMNAQDLVISYDPD